MPDEELWSSFFSPAETLTRLGLTSQTGDVVEFGCGYGTFTVAAARIARGTIHAIDVDPGMLAATAAKTRELPNVRLVERDFVDDGTDLDDESVDYAMLFNILHCEEPLRLLREARRVLRLGGLLGVMHWNYDPATPRGPSMDLRPRPQDCRDWALAAGFRQRDLGIVSLPPYHYGMVLENRAISG
jgi:SAM-dependent methyltransferase